MTAYSASELRYESMRYPRCGRSGLKLPAISFGLWHNFGLENSYANARQMLLRAFDLGITHFDLANNYGPPMGAAEQTLGRILKGDLGRYRPELLISTKAGYDFWPGPYGNWGSRKYLISSLDHSLKSMGLDYVDIFYHHRPDPDTPLEETMGALDFAVRSGRALYAGISRYPPALTRQAASILRKMGTPCIIHQTRYNLFDRAIEIEGLLPVLDEEGIGCIIFSPLAQGLLTDRYLNGVPPESRAAADGRFLKPDTLTPAKLSIVRRLNEVALSRGQSMAQMALAWVLRMPQITSVLIGASKSAQIDDAVKALDHLDFSAEELAKIEEILCS